MNILQTAFVPHDFYCLKIRSNRCPNKSPMSRRLSRVGHDSHCCIQAFSEGLVNLNPCRRMSRVCQVPTHAAEILHGSILKIHEYFFPYNASRGCNCKADLLHEVRDSSEGKQTHTKEIKGRSVPIRVF